MGKFLREEAAKLGIPTVSVPPQGTSQTCLNCGHRNNRESQAVFRCRTCGLYAHSDWTASVIIRNRAYVRYCEWRSGETPSVEDAPTGWREQPSRSGRQMMLPGLSVFKLKGNATSSRGSRVRGPKPDRRIQSGGLRRTKSLTSVGQETLFQFPCFQQSGHPFPGSLLNLSTRSSSPKSL